MALVEILNPPGSSEVAVPVSALNPMPITGNLSVGNVSLGANATVVVTSGNLTSAGNVTVTGGNLTSGGNVTVTGTPNVTGNIVVTSGNITATVSGNLTSGGNVTATGAAASGTAVSGNPVLQGGRAQSSEPTAVTNGQAVDMAFDLTGKAITSPYANRENMVRGGNTTGNTTAMQLLPSAGASVKNYITGIQLGNTGNTTINITLNDSASSVFIVPSGGGNNPPLQVPLVTAAATALTATASGNTTSVSVNVQGFTGY